MCYQKRLIYSACNHSAPLGPATTCPDQNACDGPRVHPLKTIRVEQMCPTCKRKRAKVDNSITIFAEKVRRLREELAKKGFAKGELTGSRSRSGTTSTAEDGEHGEEADGSCESGGSGKAAEHGSEDEQKVVREETSPPQCNQPTAKKGSYVGPEVDTPSSPSPTATHVSVERNDMFVGGVCVASMSLTTIKGKRLL